MIWQICATAHEYFSFKRWQLQSGLLIEIEVSEFYIFTILVLPPL
jgi:hypothetical protein